MAIAGPHHVVSRRSLLQSATAVSAVAGGVALCVGALGVMTASPAVAAGRVTLQVWIPPSTRCAGNFAAATPAFMDAFHLAASDAGPGITVQPAPAQDPAQWFEPPAVPPNDPL